MRRSPKGEVIVERIFTLNDEPLRVRYFKPQGDAHFWQCDYEIAWPNDDRCFYGAGFDGIQALLGAMMNSHAELLASEEFKRGALTLDGDRDLGLPLAGNLKPEDFH